MKKEKWNRWSGLWLGLMALAVWGAMAFASTEYLDHKAGKVLIQEDTDVTGLEIYETTADLLLGFPDMAVRYTRSVNLAETYSMASSPNNGYELNVYQEGDAAGPDTYMIAYDAGIKRLTFPLLTFFQSSFAGVGGTHTGVQVGRVAAGSFAYTVENTDDGNANNFIVYGDGKHCWGTSAAFSDVCLSRIGTANIDVSLGDLSVAGSLVCRADGTNCPAGGGGSASGSSNYTQSFTSQTTVTLTHALGTKDLLVMCYDSSDIYIGPDDFDIDAGDPWDIVVTFTETQTGRCVVNGLMNAGRYTESFSAQTTVTVTGATHGLGTNMVSVTCYDDADPRLTVEPDLITADDGTNDIVITFFESETGQCVLQ